MATILIIAQDPGLSRRLLRALEDVNRNVRAAADGLAGLQEVWRDPPDLILLGLNLPVLNGLDVLRRLRASGDSRPVLALQGDISERDWRDEAAQAGADDYLPAEAGAREVRARAAALLERQGAAKSARLRFADLVLDPERREVHRANEAVRLTTREFSVLRTLIERPQTSLSRAELGLKPGKDGSGAASRAIEILISRLRRKLARPGLPSLIVTTRGAGYSLGLPSRLRPAA
jgi:DNA-binding response OmpR family regulator